MLRDKVDVAGIRLRHTWEIDVFVVASDASALEDSFTVSLGHPELSSTLESQVRTETTQISTMISDVVGCGCFGLSVGYRCLHHGAHCCQRRREGCLRTPVSGESQVGARERRTPHQRYRPRCEFHTPRCKRKARRTSHAGRAWTCLVHGVAGITLYADHYSSSSLEGSVEVW